MCYTQYHDKKNVTVTVSIWNERLNTKLLRDIWTFATYTCHKMSIFSSYHTDLLVFHNEKNRTRKRWCIMIILGRLQTLSYLELSVRAAVCYFRFRVCFDHVRGRRSWRCCEIVKVLQTPNGKTWLILDDLTLLIALVLWSRSFSNRSLFYFWPSPSMILRKLYYSRNAFNIAHAITGSLPGVDHGHSLINL